MVRKNLTRHFRTGFIGLIAVICQGAIASTDEPAALMPENESQSVEEKTNIKTFKERFRFQTFTEFMTPAINNNQNQVPTPEGGQLIPTNTYNILWADYEFARDFKFLYWQRLWIDFANSQSAQGVGVFHRNPRFALRKVNVLNIPNLNTTYDFYIQPGWSPEAGSGGRDFEFGFRTTHSYTIPKSRWNIGATTELTYSISNQDVPGASTYGWVMSWLSYELNKTFATQTFASVNLQHNRGTTGIQWDYPMPYIQNGIGMNVTDSIWAAVFINNYMTTAPTLSNTWASLWLSITVL